MTAPTWVLLNKDLRAWERRVRLYGMDPKDRPAALVAKADEEGVFRLRQFYISDALELCRSYGRERAA